MPHPAFRTLLRALAARLGRQTSRRPGRAKSRVGTPGVERLEDRTVPTFVPFVATADGIVSDTNLDGTFDTAYAGGDAITVRWAQPAPTATGNVRGVFEFDLSRLAADTRLRSARIQLDVTNVTPSGTTYPQLEFHAYPGDGAVTPGDGGAQSALVGVATVQATGRQQFDLNPNIISDMLQFSPDRRVTIRAQLPAASAASVTVAANEWGGRAAVLTLDVPAPAQYSLYADPVVVSETTGANASTGVFTRTGDLSQAVTFTLSSDDTSEVAVPASVTFAAGQSRVTFPIATMDDAIADDVQQVTIRAEALVAGEGQPVGLDPTFGTGGLAPTDLKLEIQPARAVLARQPADGKLVAAGEDGNQSFHAIRVQRFNPDGSVDASFGAGGVVTTALPHGGFPVPNDVVVQADGKILVGGKYAEGTGTAFLVRYNSDGTLDTTFGMPAVTHAGQTGIADLTAIGGWIQDVAVRADNRIMLAFGMNGSTFFMAARLNPDGTYDTAFGGDGRIKYDGTDGSRTTGFSNALAVLPNGQFIMAGGNKVVRFHEWGGVDTGFGVGGTRTLDFGTPSANVFAIELEPLTNRIVLGASVATAFVNGSSNNFTDFAAARLHPWGELDTSFGGDGTVTAGFPAGLDDSPTTLLVQPNGSVVLAGVTELADGPTNPRWESAMVRFLPDGRLDAFAFDGDGRYQTSLIPDGTQRSDVELIFDAVLQPDGKVVALAGWGSDYRLARFDMGPGIVFISRSADLLVKDNETPNRPPVVEAVTVTIPEDTVHGINLPSARDPEFDPVTYAIAAQPEHGTVTLSGNDPTIARFVYYPAPDFVGTVTFTYTASDGTLTSAPATITVHVVAVAGAPDAPDAAFTVAADGTLQGRVTATDPDGDPLWYTVYSRDYPAHADVFAVFADGRIYYKPKPGFVGTDSFIYTVTDWKGSDVGTVTITVLGENRAPVIDDQAFTVAEDTARGGQLQASDPDGQALTYSRASQPANGTATVNPDGSFTYTPALNFAGTDTFTVQVSDGALTDTAVVTVTVTPVNDPPVADDLALSTNEDAAVTGAMRATDVDGGALTFSVTAPPANGTVSAVNATTGAFTYRPRLDFFGTDTFTYTVSDGRGGTDTATVTITVVPVNDAPRPVPPVTKLTTNEDVAVGGRLAARDPEGDAFTFSVATEYPPVHGTATVTPDGTWVFTPEPGFHGLGGFVYRVTDARGASEVGVVEVTVAPVNDAPVTAADAFTVAEDGSLVVGGVVPGFRLRMVSDPGDYIGQGNPPPPPAQPPVVQKVYDYTPADAAFRARWFSADNGVEVVVDPPGLVEQWFLRFEAPNGGPLTPGVYLGAMRAAFNDPGTPGLDVSGFGRGLNQLSGQFVVYDIAYGPSNAITRFAATFVQQNLEFDGTVDPPLHGGVVFNSTFGAGGGVLANDADPDGDLLLGATLVGGPAHGALVFNRDGTFRYTPNPNFTGTDSFTYRTSDPRAESNVATVTITVTPVNDAPVARDGAVTTPEDTSVSGSVSATDADGDSLTYALVSGPAAGAGTLTFNADGSFAYTPAANYFGTASFTYLANDGAADSNVATVAITVTAVNDPPTADGGTLTTAEDTPASGAVTGIDVEGSTLTFVRVTGPAHGTLDFAADGTFTYTPATNYHGPDAFTFKVGDGTGESAPVTVSITVTSVEDVPAAVADSYATDEDAALTVAARGVLGNDTDGDGDALTAALVSGPAHGTLTLNADGSFAYAPASNYHGPDSFTYKASQADGSGTTATVSLTVRPVADAPVASGWQFGTDEDTPLGEQLRASDADGGSLTYVVVDGPEHGTVAVDRSTGAFVYTPAANYHGPDGFTFKVNDGQTDSNVARVFLTVRPVNDAPAARDLSASTDEDTLLAGTVTAADVDGPAPTYTVVTGPAHGSLILNADGSFTYTPSANYYGADSFTFTASDGTAASNVGTVSLTVRSVNDAPVPAARSVTTPEDTAAGGTLSAADADGDWLTFALATAPAHGTAAVNPDGTFTYTPVPNYHGTDSFTYTVSDGSGGTATATVAVTVTPVNDAPLAADDAYEVNEDAVLTVTPHGVLFNDADVDGDTLTAALVSGPAHGTLKLNADGTFVYTPAPNYHGPDSFTYRAGDGTADGNAATVTLTVRSVNNAPVAGPDHYAAAEDTTLTVPAAGVLGNDTDADGGPLAASLASGPTNGTVTVAADGSFVYTPKPNFHGTDSFTYTVSDGNGGTATGAVTVTVSPVNDLPVAADDTAETAEDTAVTIRPLANDTDPDGDALTVTAVTQGARGAVLITGGGTVSYTPAANFFGTDTFTYTVSDGKGGTDTATVSVTVTPVNDRPVANSAAVTTREDQAVSGRVTGSDADGDALRFELVSAPANGTAVLNADGTFTYTPRANYHGPDSFTFKASDSASDSAAGTVSVTVTPVSDAPAAAGDAYEVAAGGSLTVAAPGVLSNDSDADGDALTAALVSGPASGTLALRPDGSFTYTPAAGFSGTDSFTYRAADGAAGAQATVTIRVRPVDPATDGKVSGSGAVDGGARTFGVSVQSKDAKGGRTYAGSLTFEDRATGVSLRSTGITFLRVEADGQRATIRGTASVNGRSGYTFTATLTDKGEPGRADTFRIQITGPGGYAYDSLALSPDGGLLDAGNIQVHRN